MFRFQRRPQHPKPMIHTVVGGVISGLTRAVVQRLLELLSG